MYMDKGAINIQNAFNENGDYQLEEYVCDYCKETLSSKRRLELEQEMMSNEDYIKLVKNIENYKESYENNRK